jgi:hypothetical protein
MSDLEKRLMDDPSVSYWLKDQIRATDRRDVLDAYYDLEMLWEVVKQRAELALGHSPRRIKVS